MRRLFALAAVLSALLALPALADTATPSPSRHKARPPQPCTPEFEPIASAIDGYCNDKPSRYADCKSLLYELHKRRCRELVVSWDKDILHVVVAISDVWLGVELKLVDGEWRVLGPV